MPKRVFVTGVGIITAVGTCPDEVLQSIAGLKRGLGPVTLFETRHRESFPVCEVRLTNAELTAMAGLGKNSITSRTALLGLIAAREAAARAGIRGGSNRRTGLISANSVGGMDCSEQFFDTFAGDSSRGKLRRIVEHDAGESTERIAARLGISDFVTTISTACSSSANAILLGARLIRAGMLDRVVAGGCDALTRFTLNGFLSLKILDPQGCRPFDETRAGLNLGEGAGFLVLEAEETVAGSGKHPLCTLSGYANTCDAYHQTASSPEGNGPYRAMQEALAGAGLAPAEIDYINAHGTGTPNNDLSEGKAILRLFGQKPPSISSTKPFTGHTLGAAGGIEAVLAALAIVNDWIYPNPGFQTPINELNLIPETRLLKNRGIRHVMSNSFGFGGNNTSLIFSRF